MINAAIHYNIVLKSFVPKVVPQPWMPPNDSRHCRVKTWDFGVKRFVKLFTEIQFLLGESNCMDERTLKFKKLNTFFFGSVHVL